MRALSCVLCFVILFNFSTSSAFAGSLTIERGAYGSTTAIHGEGLSPLVGSLHDHNLTLLVNDNLVEVQLIDPNSNSRRTIVSGVLFSPHLISEDGQTSFNAFVYWNAGEKLAELLGEDAQTAELVVAKDGRRMAGKITSVDKNEISVFTNGIELKLSTKLISTVVSSRVFKLTTLVFPTAESGKAHFHAKIARFEFEPTLEEMMTVVGKKRLEKRISEASIGRTQRWLFIGAAVALTAAAIAIPVAIAAPIAGRNRIKPDTDDRDNDKDRTEPEPPRADDTDQDTAIR